MYHNVCSSAFLIFLFPFKLFLLLLLRPPLSKQSLSHLCPFALLQCLSQYKDHMRQQSREPKDIRERAVCATSSFAEFINVHETHLHYYPFSQEPTQTANGGRGTYMYICSIWILPAQYGCILHTLHKTPTVLYVLYSRVVSMYFAC